MAQTMLLNANVAGCAVDFKKEPLIQRLRPKSVSHFFLPDLHASSSHSISVAPIVALFKSKAKAPAKKVIYCS